MNLQTREYIPKFPKDLQQLCYCLDFLGYNIDISESSFPGLPEKYKTSVKSVFLFNLYGNKYNYTIDNQYTCVQSSLSKLIIEIYSTIDKFLQNIGMNRKSLIMKCQIMGFQN